jgi:5,10-methylenetetrahydrofolate reductase
MNWLRKVRAAGKRVSTHVVSPFRTYHGYSLLLGIDVPVIPGVMPIQSYASFMRLTKLCGTRVPQQLLDQINPIRVSTSSPIINHSPTELFTYPFLSKAR